MTILHPPSSILDLRALLSWRLILPAEHLPQ